jgi:hypothetical protein
MVAIQPKQCVRILTLQIAVPDDSEPDAVADEPSWLLSENEVRRELTKPWQDLVQNQLDREVLVV